MRHFNLPQPCTCWNLPTREWLGQYLLADGQYAEAESVYRAELAKHPKNGRVLFGLTEALRHQNKSTRSVRREFQEAWANADTKLQTQSNRSP